MLPPRFVVALQRLLKWATVIYVIALPLILVVVNWRGERNLLTSVLLFVPPQGWLSPLALLTPLCLLFRPRLCWLHLLALFVVLFGFMRFHWSTWPQPKGHTLTIISANIGQRKLSSLKPFCDAEDPDIIAYQDASSRAQFVRRENAGRFFASEGQFAIASRFPVKKSGAVPELVYRGRPIAARFELETGAATVVIYNIHMPTPRQMFTKLRGRGLAAEMVKGGGVYSRNVREEYRIYWRERERLANALVQILRAEQHPYILAGDFNMPDHGPLFRSLRSEFTDVFAARGVGYGLTFPGITRNPATWFGPWLRIDYIFARKDLRPIYCRVEPRQAAQHRAIVAMFDLNR